MDPFKLLTQGARFNKNNPAHKAALFSQKQQQQKRLDATGSSDEDSEDEPGQGKAAGEGEVGLPAELDFFKVGGAAPGAGGGSSKGKRKREDAGLIQPRTLPTPTNRLNLTGRSPPPALTDLAEFISKHTPPTYIIRNLTEMGISEMSEVGRGAGAVMMAGRDLIALAPTGSGKTLSYLLPLLTILRQPASSLQSAATPAASDPSSSSKTKLSRGPRALILSPTRELALQIQNECAKLTQGRKWRVVVLSKANEKSVAEGVDILISTPLRLTQTIKNTSLSLASTEHIILDESDRLLDPTFLPIVDEVLSACSSPDLKRYLFTATLPSSLEEIAKGLGAGDGVRVVVGLKDAATSLINQRLLFTGTEAHKLQSLRQILTSAPLSSLSSSSTAPAFTFQPPCLIFVQSIPRANDLFHELVYDGLHVDVIHSERTPAERERVVKEFREGRVWVLVTTELMGRGMDFRGINLVVNYDFPTSVQSYVHRIGRTGRAGRSGEAITFFTNEDAPYLKMIANVMRQSGCEVPEWMTALKNPSKKQRKQIKKKPLERTDVRTVGGAGIGRQKAVKQREMVEGSKRRKTKEVAGRGGKGGAGAGGEKEVDLAEGGDDESD